MIQCFWMESTGRSRRSLRRYSSRDGVTCPGGWTYHNAHGAIDDVPFTIVTSNFREGYQTCDYAGADSLELFPSEDSRWPVKCEHCDYAFTDDDARQVFMDEIYRRTDTGEELALRDAPPGAMWDAWWYGSSASWSWPIEGIHLMVRCPGKPDGSGKADWYVDGRAGNADPNQRGWTRSGDPKTKPPTISANPSIQIGGVGSSGYHGWLRNGQLVNA